MTIKALEHEVTVLKKHRFTVTKADLGLLEFSKKRLESTVTGHVRRTAAGWEWLTVCANPKGSRQTNQGTEQSLVIAVTKVCLAEGMW